MAITFAGDDTLLLGASRLNQLIIWDLDEGALRDTEDWTYDLEGLQSHTFRSPIAADFSIEQGLLAVVYRGQDNLIRSLEEDAAYELYSKEVGLIRGERESSRGIVSVLAITFSKGLDTSLLAASYPDGDLVLFDTCEGTVKDSVLANSQMLACSPDGRTLATNESNGTISLFDFESLRFLYRISSEKYGIKALAFSADCHRLIDIRGSHCRVWDPLVLIRQSVDEQQSDTVSISTAPQEIDLTPDDEINTITAIAVHDNGEILFCGKEDGSVCLYEIKNGLQNKILFWHARGVPIMSIAFDLESSTVTTTDLSSRVMIHKLIKRQRTWEVDSSIFDYRGGTPVDQLLGNMGNTRMLICSGNKDVLYTVTPTSATMTETILYGDRSDAYRWSSNPIDRSVLIHITAQKAHLYSWDTLTKLTPVSGIVLDSVLSDLDVRAITPHFGGGVLATAFSEPLGTYAESKLVLWSTSDFAPSSTLASALPNSQSFADQVEVLIGIYTSRVVFLDNSGWIYSAGADTFDVVRHFFVPADWLRTNSQLRVTLTKNGDLLFVKRDEVAVIKRGLYSSENGVAMIGPGKRPSLGGTRELSMRSKSPAEGGFQSRRFGSV